MNFSIFCSFFFPVVLRYFLPAQDRKTLQEDEPWMVNCQNNWVLGSIRNQGHTCVTSAILGDFEAGRFNSMAASARNQ